ncbi:MAG TPA: alpha/beta hydrolase [Actinomycetota bacterium]|nr:alpha/beta hydrolase [Actinomycetota bacterium]
MQLDEYKAHRKSVTTSKGEVAYAEFGDGPAAVFVHGVFMNGFVWRNVIEGVKDIRRCIAIDLPAHGETKVEAENLGLKAHADLIAEVSDKLELGEIDLVGNDTGGAICQLFAVDQPDRLRSLTLTNCDVNENLPPEAFQGTVDLALAGELAPAISAIANDINAARSEAGMGLGYEHPEKLSDEEVFAFLGYFREEEAGRSLERRIASIASHGNELVEIEPKLRKLDVPTLIVWGTNDQFFGLEWAYWLKDRIPGVTEVVEIEGGKLFFIDERADEMIPYLRKHWEAR